MIKYIKTSISITNKYIILAFPLILFSLVSGLYILFTVNGSFLSLLIAGLLYLFMLATFLAGWFYMIKITLQERDTRDANELVQIFPSGVGEYFVPILGFLFNIIILSTVILAISYILGMKFIGEIGIAPEALTKAMGNAAALKSFLLSLSEEQLTKLNAWNLLIFLSMFLTYFLIMFYPPALFFKNRNPFKALFIAFKDLFSHKIFQNLLLFIVISISYIFLSIITTIAGMNIILHFIFTLANFYYLVFVTVLIFEFYFSNFVKIGSNFDKRV